MDEPGPSIRGSILAFLLGCGMALVLGELGLRALGYGAIFDIYSKPSIFWIYDPLLGWSQEPNSSGVFIGPRPWPTEYSTPIRINSLGLRGPEFEEVPPGGYRVLVLGDSLTAAFEVPYEETFIALLQEELTRRLGVSTQVVNAGVRGYGTDQSYLYYRERGRQLEPDLVVLYFIKNDIRNNVTIHRMRRPFAKGAFALRPDGDLELLGVPVPRYPACSAYRLTPAFQIEQFASSSARAVCWIQIKLFDHSALFTFVAMAAQQYPELLRSLYFLGDMREAQQDLLATNNYPQQLTTRLIRELAHEVRLDGAQFMLMGRSERLAFLDLEQLGASSIEIVDVNPIYGENIEEVRFVHDAHWNTLGHGRLADLLAPILEEQLRSRPPRRSAVASGIDAPPAVEDRDSTPDERRLGGG